MTAPCSQCDNSCCVCCPDLVAEITRLEAQLAQVQGERDAAMYKKSDYEMAILGKLRTAEGSIEALTTQVRRLTEALRKYGKHLDDCALMSCQDMDPEPCFHNCTCGRDAALTEGT